MQRLEQAYPRLEGTPKAFEQAAKFYQSEIPEVMPITVEYENSRICNHHSFNVSYEGHLMWVVWLEDGSDDEDYEGYKEHWQPAIKAEWERQQQAPFDKEGLLVKIKKLEERYEVVEW